MVVAVVGAACLAVYGTDRHDPVTALGWAVGATIVAVIIVVATLLGCSRAPAAAGATGTRSVPSSPAPPSPSSPASAGSRSAVGR